MQPDSHKPAPNTHTPASDSRGYARSRVSNGPDLFLVDVDGRSREARRYRDVYADLLTHLGGNDHVSEARRHLAKRATALIVWCEIVESKLAAGDSLDVGAYTTSVNTLRRLLADLGLDPTQRNLTPSLADYLAAKEGTPA